MLIAKVQAEVSLVFQNSPFRPETYDGQTEPVQTTAVKMLLLTDASMPERCGV